MELTKIKMIIGALLLISAALGGKYFDTNLPIYQCVDRGVIHPCWKLSNPNAITGLSSWCYWNVSNSRGDYFTCK